MMPLIPRILRWRQFWLRTLMIAAVAVGSTLLVTSIHHGKANSDGCGRTPFPEGYRSGIRSTTKSLEYEPRDFGFGFQSYAITDAQLADVAKLWSLEELGLADTCVSDEGVRHLATLRPLRVLRLCRTKISDASLLSIARLRNLEMLDLSGTKITSKGVGRLVELNALRVLALGGTRISDAALAHVSKLARLEDLYLNNNRIGDKGVRYLASLPKLEYLDLRATRVTDEGLKILPQFGALEILRLDECVISDAGIAHLSGVKSLEFVDLYHAKHVTATGVARLKELRPDIQIGW